MFRSILSIFIIFLITTMNCTKEIEKIIYPEGNPDAKTGSIVGLVKQKASQALVIVRQAKPVDSTLINPVDGIFQIDNLAVGNYDLLITAQNYRPFVKQNVMVNAGGVTYTGEIELSDVPELVASFYPENKSELVFDQRWSQLCISITFTESMNRKSVEEAFSTNPPSEGVFYWGVYSESITPSYFWNEKYLYDRTANPGANITTYKNIKSFTYRMARKDSYTDTTYTITLTTVAKDTAGNFLKFPLKFTFSTVQSASTQNAILTQPENGDIYIDPIENNSIYLTFPRRMNQASVEEAITVSPGSDLIYVWPAANQLRIYTGGPLRCSTLYAIHLNKSARDLDGYELGEPFEFSFETAPIEMQNTTPQRGEIFVSRKSKIILDFNTYMVLSSMQAAFNISPLVRGTFIRGYENGNGSPRDVITFMPSEVLQPNVKYTVTIGTNAIDLHGANLKEPYTFAFVTEPE